MTKTDNKPKLLPFDVISAAASGDTEAISIVLKHYDGYIVKLSTRLIKDEFGIVHTFLDEELYNRLKIRLIMRTLAFAP